MVRLVSRTLLALIVAFVVGAVAVGQSVQLRYAYRQGERLRYDVTLKGNGTISSPTLGQNDPFEMSGTLAYVQDVQKVDQSGNATLHTVVQDSTINATWGGQPIPVALALPPLTVQTTPTGKILSCTVASASTQQLPGLGLAGADMATQAFDFSKFFGSTQNIGFPVAAVSPGSEWADTSTVTTPDGARLVITSSSKLLGFADYQGVRCAKIYTTYKAPISLEMVQLGIPFKLAGSEEGTMTAYFAPAEGRLIASLGKVVADLTMSGQVAVGGERQQVVAVGMQSQTDVRVRLAGVGAQLRGTSTRSR